VKCCFVVSVYIEILLGRSGRLAPRAPFHPDAEIMLLFRTAVGVEPLRGSTCSYLEGEDRVQAYPDEVVGLIHGIGPTEGDGLISPIVFTRRTQ
ncbi:hypothetical protein A2U01_0062891, partial [Trifolium medium]|nr:hypothetical protein [Trifolium medium]